LFSFPILAESWSFSFLVVVVILLSSCLRSFSLPSTSSPFVVFLGASAFAVNVFLAGLVFSDAICPLVAFYKKAYKKSLIILHNYTIYY